MPHECLHEEQIRGISRKTSELEANAKYHEKHLDELNLSLKDLQHSIDNISDTINEFILKSVNDDSDLKEYITGLENRIIMLETAKNEQWKLFTGLGVLIPIVSFVITYLLK